MPFDGTDYDPVVGALRLAKDIIAERGWKKYSLGEAGGPRCVIGAIREAAAIIAIDDVRFHEIAWDAAYCYGTATRINAIRVTVWQDSPERKLEEVFDGFDRAVERRFAMVAEVARVA